ncbi:MAG TPA: hypothetical protein VGJ00_00655 [Rhabdochlamydiaceae bacterium]|jgi:WD40 repeat protein
MVNPQEKEKPIETAKRGMRIAASMKSRNFRQVTLPLSNFYEAHFLNEKELVLIHLKKIDIYDCEKEKTVRTIVDKNMINRTAISPDQDIAVAGLDSPIFIWDSKKCSIKSSLKGHQGTIHNTLSFLSPRHLISATNDGSIKIWDVSTEHACAVIKNKNADLITRISQSTFAMSNREQPIIEIVDVETQKTFSNLHGHEKSIQCLTHLENETSLVGSSSLDYTIKFWNVTSEKCINTFQEKSLCRSLIGLPNHAFAAIIEERYLRISTIAGKNLMLEPLKDHGSFKVSYNKNGVVAISGMPSALLLKFKH